jgi:hypothetical protein
MTLPPNLHAEQQRLGALWTALKEEKAHAELEPEAYRRRVKQFNAELGAHLDRLDAYCKRGAGTFPARTFGQPTV